MKWFKHDSNANTDAKLKKLRHKYGIQAYGLYWYCLELIAGRVDKNNITFELEEDAETIAMEWNMDQIKVQEMMQYMCDIKLFSENSGVIRCLKLAKRLDDTNAKNPQIKSVLDRINQNHSELVGATPSCSEKVAPDKIRIDKNKYVPEDLELAEYLHARILKNNPKFKKPNLDSWANDFRLMRERDDRSISEIRSLIEFSQGSAFWRANILSAGKLREKFDQLWVQASPKPRSDEPSIFEDDF